MSGAQAVAARPAHSAERFVGSEALAEHAGSFCQQLARTLSYTVAFALVSRRRRPLRPGAFRLTRTLRG